jgi:hypothetical protein
LVPPFLEAVNARGCVFVVDNACTFRV